MSGGLRVFAGGFLDYAGLFPPAKLDLGPAIATYARDRAGPDAWMLGRFICPASQLAALGETATRLLRDHPPFRFSALLRGGASREEFLEGARRDGAEIVAFEQRYDGATTVEAVECRVPAEVVAEGSSGVAALIEQTRRGLAEAGCVEMADAYEFAWSGDWRRAVNVVANGVAEHNARRSAGTPPAAVKMRCGGVEAAAFPGLDQVGHALLACWRVAAPLKLTAGLHHPVRRFDAGVQCQMHGFLNVFGAAILLHCGALQELQLASLLADESPEAFRFSEDGFAWRGVHATRPQIARARAAAILGFGSCSYDEPRADLRAMGALDAAG